MRTVPTLFAVTLMACSDKSEVPPDETDATPSLNQSGDADTDADADTDTDTDADTDTPPEDCAPAVPKPVVPELCPAPWEGEIEWVQAEPQGPVNASPEPSIARFVDDDGDGVLTDADLPNTTWVNELHAHVWSGDGAGPVLELDTSGDIGLDRWLLGGSMIADVDGDGRTELLLGRLDSSYPEVGNLIVYAEAYDADGTLKWSSPALQQSELHSLRMMGFSAADVDGDGIAEVITELAVLDGATGAIRSSFDLPPVSIVGLPLTGRDARAAPVVADLDLDGVPEILLAGNVYAPDGSVTWSSGLFVTELSVGQGTHAAVIQADADPEAEVVFVRSDEMWTFEHDGTLIGGPFSAPGAYPHGPCVADFDGDGVSEVAIVTENAVHMLEADGTRQWSHPLEWGAYACTAFDFDANGIFEIVASDIGDQNSPNAEMRVVVLDGRYGRERFSIPVVSTPDFAGGVLGTPVVADVDLDGIAEIVVTRMSMPNGGGGGGSTIGLSVIGPTGDDWAGAGSSWSLSDFTEGRLDDYGNVALPPVWEDGLFRGRNPTSVPQSSLEAPQLRAEIIDVCSQGCADADTQHVSVQVSNTGSAVAPAGATLSLVADAAGSIVADADVPELEASEAIVFTFDVAVNELPGRLGVRIDAPFEQCDPAPERFDIPDAVCP